MPERDGLLARERVVAAVDGRTITGERVGYGIGFDRDPEPATFTAGDVARAVRDGLYAYGVGEELIPHLSAAVLQALGATEEPA